MIMYFLRWGATVSPLSYLVLRPRFEEVDDAFEWYVKLSSSPDREETIFLFALVCVVVSMCLKFEYYEQSYVML